MLTRLHRAALGATFPFLLATAAARAQPKVQTNPFAKQPLTAAPQTQTNPFAKPSDSNSNSLRGNQNQPDDAFFGDIEIDESRAQILGDLIDAKRLKKQIADLDGTLSYREGALGFYRVGYEAIGTRNDGTVRVTVTIVGQSGDRTILATSQSVQRWRDGVFLYQEPKFNTRTPAPNDNQFGAQGPVILKPLKPMSNGSSANSRFARSLLCAPDPNPKRDKDKGDDKPRSAPDSHPKIDSSRAPDPTPPRRETKPEPQREPERKPEPQRAPDPTPPKREERPEPPREPQRRPEPPRTPDPFPPDAPQRQLPPISPPILRAPDPNPPSRSGNRAPDPNPPYRGGSTSAPNPNPPSRGGVHNESRPPRRPVWDGRNDPYRRYPYPDSYPYPYPAPYPYPYPVPYPAPYPAPFPYPYPDPTTVYGAREGARQAFDYALVQARVDAETDFDRQLWGEDTRESLVQNQW